MPFVEVVRVVIKRQRVRIARCRRKLYELGYLIAIVQVVLARNFALVKRVPAACTETLEQRSVILTIPARQIVTRKSRVTVRQNRWPGDVRYGKRNINVPGEAINIGAVAIVITPGLPYHFGVHFH